MKNFKKILKNLKKHLKIRSNKKYFCKRKKGRKTTDLSEMIGKVRRVLYFPISTSVTLFFANFVKILRKIAMRECQRCMIVRFIRELEKLRTYRDNEWKRDLEKKHKNDVIQFFIQSIS